ncbi:MAG: iron-sulfur cluster assembly scaffold protein [Novosphingobium sp.]
MAGAEVLYTPEVLGLATSLANFPWRDDLPLHGEARSPTCGSAVRLALDCDPDGRIADFGIRAHACAIGQAAAAIFARAAKGRDRAEIAESARTITRWLDGEDGLPGWPGFAAIASARDYPARHGAILLAWKAALAALPSPATAR